MFCDLFSKFFWKKETSEANDNKPTGATNPTNTYEPTTVAEPVPVTNTGSTVEPTKPVTKMNTNLVVLLDNGHASSTPGKRSPLFPDGKTRFFEYEFNRDVVKRITKKLDALGIRYHVLVPEVDTDVALTTRANRCNEYCKKYGANNCILISVHSNALGDGSSWQDSKGWSVWTTVGVTKSDEYAKVFYNVAEEMLKKYDLTCRHGRVQGNGNDGPDYESNFTIIYKAWCPAILTENLFYTNKKECEFLMSDIGREVIADIHVEAIKRWAENI